MSGPAGSAPTVPSSARAVQAGLDACVASVRRAATVAVIAIHLGDRSVQPEGWVWRDLTVAGVWSFKIWDTPTDPGARSRPGRSRWSG